MEDDSKPAADAGEQRNNGPQSVNSMDEGENSDYANSGTETPSSGGRRGVKPALKKEDVIMGEEGDAANEKKEKQKHLKWDEKAIEEHDQLRGTRMKIEEANTPFAYYDSGAESDSSRSRAKSPNENRVTLSWDVLQTKLDSVAAVQQQFPSSPSSHADTDHDSVVEEEQKKEMRKMEFREHRKRHYNEMELVRRFRMEHADDDDDDDDDADDEGGDA